MFDNKLGLIIDDEGIFDNAHAASVGLIRWADIIAIETAQVKSARFLLIYTLNPEFYLNRVNGFRRKLMEGNNRAYGTPLSITTTALKNDFADVQRWVTEKFEEQLKRRNT